MGTNKAEEIKSVLTNDFGYDFESEFFTDEIKTLVDEVIEVTNNSSQSEIDELKLDIAEREKVIDFQKRKMLFTDMTELPSKDSEIEGLIKERDELTKACEYKDRLYKGLNGMLQEKENEVLELTKEVERLKVLNKRLFTLWESLYSPNKLII